MQPFPHRYTATAKASLDRDIELSARGLSTLAHRYGSGPREARA